MNSLIFSRSFGDGQGTCGYDDVVPVEKRLKVL
jgi:hypothetical protein